MDLRSQLSRVLALQADYASRHSAAMVERNELVTHEIPSSLRGALRQTALAIDHKFLHIYGSGAAGLNAKVPWVLISDKRFTESAQDGWYLVLLLPRMAADSTCR